MEYKISSVGFFSTDTYGRDNNHRVMVKFEGVDKEYSAFVQEKPKEGDVWNGELKTVAKDGKTYYNFEFARKSSKGAGINPDLERRLGIACDDISAVRKNLMELGRALLEAGVIKRPASTAFGQPYPERDGTNDMHPLEDNPF